MDRPRIPGRPLRSKSEKNEYSWAYNGRAAGDRGHSLLPRAVLRWILFPVVYWRCCQLHPDDDWGGARTCRFSGRNVREEAIRKEMWIRIASPQYDPSRHRHHRWAKPFQRSLQVPQGRRHTQNKVRRNTGQRVFAARYAIDSIHTLSAHPSHPHSVSRAHRSRCFSPSGSAAMGATWRSPRCRERRWRR